MSHNADLGKPITAAGRSMLAWLDFVREKTGWSGVPGEKAIAAIERQAYEAGYCEGESSAQADEWFRQDTADEKP